MTNSKTSYEVRTLGGEIEGVTSLKAARKHRTALLKNARRQGLDLDAMIIRKTFRDGTTYTEKVE